MKQLERLRKRICLGTWENKQCKDSHVGKSLKCRHFVPLSKSNPIKLYSCSRLKNTFLVWSYWATAKKNSGCCYCYCSISSCSFTVALEHRLLPGQQHSWLLIAPFPRESMTQVVVAKKKVAVCSVTRSVRPETGYSVPSKKPVLELGNDKLLEWPPPGSIAKTTHTQMLSNTQIKPPSRRLHRRRDAEKNNNDYHKVTCIGYCFSIMNASWSPRKSPKGTLITKCGVWLWPSLRWTSEPERLFFFFRLWYLCRNEPWRHHGQMMLDGTGHELKPDYQAKVNKLGCWV